MKIKIALLLTCCILVARDGFTQCGTETFDVVDWCENQFAEWTINDPDPDARYHWYEIVYDEDNNPIDTIDRNYGENDEGTVFVSPFRYTTPDPLPAGYTDERTFFYIKENIQSGFIPYSDIDDTNDQEALITAADYSMTFTSTNDFRLNSVKVLANLYNDNVPYYVQVRVGAEYSPVYFFERSQTTLLENNRYEIEIPINLDIDAGSSEIEIITDPLNPDPSDVYTDERDLDQLVWFADNANNNQTFSGGGITANADVYSIFSNDRTSIIYDWSFISYCPMEETPPAVNTTDGCCTPVINTVGISAEETALDVANSETSQLTITTGAPGNYYQWFLDGSPVGIGSTGQPPYTATTPGTYTVREVEDASFVDNISCYSEGIIEIQERVLFTRLLAPDPEPATYCVGDEITLEAFGDFTEVDWSSGAAVVSPDSRITTAVLTTATTGQVNFIVEGEVVLDNKIINGDFETGDLGGNSSSEMTVSTGQPSPGQFRIGTIVRDQQSFWNASGGLNDNVNQCTHDGNFFYADGFGNSNTTLDVIWEQTVTVEPNKDFVFSMDHTNISWNADVSVGSRVADSDVEFEVYVNDQLISTFSTDGNSENAGVCRWKTDAGNWNSGTSTQAVVSIRQSALTQVNAGNDFAIDNIYFGGPGQQQSIISVGPVEDCFDVLVDTDCIDDERTLFGAAVNTVTGDTVGVIEKWIEGGIADVATGDSVGTGSTIVVNPSSPTFYTAIGKFPAASLIFNGNFNDGVNGFNFGATNGLYNNGQFRGQFDVITNPSSTPCNTFCVDIPDHTTGGNGNYLFVDPADDDGDVISYTFDATSGETYLLSLWIASVVDYTQNTNAPISNVSFIVNGPGVNRETISSIDLPQDNDWRELLSAWVAPQDGEYELIIRALGDNSLTGSDGNDFVIDDIRLASTLDQDYYAEIEVGPCFDCQPGEITASQDICYNTVPNDLENATLPVLGSGDYTYTWEASLDGVTFVEIPTASGVDLIDLSMTLPLTDTTWIRRKEESGVCSDIYSDTVVINVAPQLDPGAITEDQEICEGDTPDPFSELTAPSGDEGIYTFQWQSSLDSAAWSDIASNATSATYTEPDPLTATTWYRRVVSTPRCGDSASAPVKVTVNPVPDDPDPVDNWEYCQFTDVSALDIEDNVTGSGLGTFDWFDEDDNPLTDTPTLTSTTAGVTTYGVRENIGGCVSGIVPITVTVLAQPTKLEVDDEAVCEEGAVDLTTLVTGGTSLTWYTDTTVAGSASAPSVVTTTPGEFLYFVTDTENGCESFASTITITVNADPEPVISGPDPVCETITATYSTDTTGIATFDWVVTGNGTVSGADDVDSLQVIPGNGTDFTVQVNVVDRNGCAGSGTETIGIDELPPVADIIGEIDDTVGICLSDPTIQMPGNNPAPGTGTWTEAPSNAAEFGAIEQINAFDSPLTVGSLNGGDVIGAIWTISNGACPETDDTVFVKITDKVNPSVSLSPGPDVAVCSGEQVTFRLAGQNGGSDPQFAFYDQDDNLLSTDPESDSLQLTLDGSITSIYGTMVSNSSCLEDPNNDLATSGIVTISVETPPSVADITGYDPNELIETCRSSVALSSATITVGTKNWYIESILDESGVDDFNAGAENETLAPGVTSVVLLEVAGVLCPSTFDSVRIERKADIVTPVPNFVDSTVCEDVTGLTIIETSTPGDGETPAWAAVAPATISAGGVVGNLQLGPNTFYLIYDNGSCADTTEIVVTSDELPGNAALIDDQTLIETCSETTNLNGITPTPGTGVWTIVDGSDGSIADPTDPNAEVAGIPEGGEGTYIWTVSNGACVDRDQIEVEINRLGAITDAEIAITGDLTQTLTSDGTVDLCLSGSYSLAPAKSISADEILEWSIVSGGTFASIPEGSTPSQSVSFTDAGTTQVMLRIEKTGALAAICPADFILLDMVIWDDPTAEVTLDPDPVDVCEGDPIEFTGAVMNEDTFEWLPSGFSLSATEAAQLNFTKSDIPGSNTAYSVVLSADNPGCDPVFSTPVSLRVTGNDLPRVSLSVATEDQIVCEAESDVWVVASPQNGGTPSYSWSIDGDPIAETSDTLTLPTDLTPGIRTVEILMESSVICAVTQFANTTLEIQVIAQPDPSISADSVRKCITEAPIVLTVAGNQSGSNLSWIRLEEGEIATGGGPTLDVDQTGTYVLIEDNGECPEDSSNTLDLIVDLEPDITFDENPLVYFGEDEETYILDVPGTSIAPFTEIAWSSNDPLVTVLVDGVEEPTMEFETTGLYEVEVEATNGNCSDTRTLSIILRGKVNIPNTFTPDDDGTNDVWVIRGIETYPDAIVKIFNRWGKLIYETYGGYESWDGTRNGKELPAATYYYVIDLGTPTEGGEQEFSGDITIWK